LSSSSFPAISRSPESWTTCAQKKRAGRRALEQLQLPSNLSVLGVMDHLSAGTVPRGSGTVWFQEGPVWRRVGVVQFGSRKVLCGAGWEWRRVGVAVGRCVAQCGESQGRRLLHRLLHMLAFAVWFPAQAGGGRSLAWCREARHSAGPQQIKAAVPRNPQHLPPQEFTSH
jgi:hypothetical protein